MKSEPLIPISFPVREPLPEGAALLCADVGGTKTDLALFELRDGLEYLHQKPNL